ncbi:11721_t:CDS:2 [Ambispora gerdemannii]|uniref:11721_t:CDS:1 n=1 Tax=Ambispora gerdemannii TaxID=144530 RepID=A0A9N9C7H4_9GLOM|nr:11721_t:CDS:2 [Ambispora gerdemannii]
MKPSKKKVYIRNGIIYHGDEAIHAKKLSEAEKQVKELKVSLENIAACDSNGPSDPNDPNDPNDMPTFSACNGEKDGCDRKTFGKISLPFGMGKAQFAKMTTCGNVLGSEKKVGINHYNSTQISGQARNFEATVFDSDYSRNIIGDNNKVKIDDENVNVANYLHENVQITAVNEVAHDNIIGSNNRVNSKRVNRSLINSRVGNVNLTGVDASLHKNVIGDGNMVTSFEANLTGINIEHRNVNITGIKSGASGNVIGDGNIVTSLRAKATLINSQTENINISGPDVSKDKTNIGRNLKLDGRATFTGINHQRGNIGIKKDKSGKLKFSADATLFSNQENNIIINKGQSGIRASITGTGRSTGNIVISEPSLGADIGFSGQVSSGNVSIGTRLQLNFGPSLDIGLPLGGSSSGDDNNDDNNKSGDNKGGDNKGGDNKGGDNKGGDDKTGSDDRDDGGDPNTHENKDNIKGGDDKTGSDDRDGGGDLNTHENKDNIKGGDDKTGSDDRDGGGDPNTHENKSDCSDKDVTRASGENDSSNNETAPENYFFFITSNQDSALEFQNDDIYGSDQSNCNNTSTYQPYPTGDFIISTNGHDQTTTSNSFQNGDIHRDDQSNDNDNDSNTSTFFTSTDGYSSLPVMNDLNSFIVEDVTTSSFGTDQGSAQDAQSNHEPIKLRNISLQADNTIEGNSNYIINNGNDSINHIAGEANHSSAENKFLPSTTSNDNTKSSLSSGNDNTKSSILDSADGAGNPQSLTVFEQVLADTIREHPHLAPALRTSLYNTTPTSDSNSKSSGNSAIDIDAFIKRGIHRAEVAVKHKQAQKDDSNLSVTSGPSESTRAEEATKGSNQTQKKGGSTHSVDDKLSQKKSKEDEKEEEEDEKEEEEEDKPAKPCKNHSPSVRCFRCLSGAKGKKVKKLRGNVFGFAS